MSNDAAAAWSAYNFYREKALARAKLADAFEKDNPEDKKGLLKLRNEVVRIQKKANEYKKEADILYEQMEKEEKPASELKAVNE